MLTKLLFTPRTLAERYHRGLPEEVRHYLKGRGIPATMIDGQLLGWNGELITVPVFDSEKKNVLGFCYATPPADLSGRPEMISDAEMQPELYGWEVLARTPHRVVITEGELDALVLRARGVPAVASTGGADVFLSEWVPHFQAIPDIFICFSRTGAGDRAAVRVQKHLPQARIARLPQDVGEGGTVADYFSILGMQVEDFEVMLAAGKAAISDPTDLAPQVKILHAAERSEEKRAEHLRTRIPLHAVVFSCMRLQAAGGRLVGHCPFHDDSARSFTVYPPANVYRCSGCGAEGDAVSFLMNKESMTFGQALEALERFEATGELYGAA